MTASPWLRHLNLCSCDQVQSLGPLAACAPTLTHLDLSECTQLSDAHLGVLSGCTALTYL